MKYALLDKSLFEGSMVGKGAVSFAVWVYVIANTSDEDGRVTLNPQLLAFLLGHATPEDVETAIWQLCQPDPESRNKEEEGRRLVKEDGFQYRVVSWPKYHALKKTEERREYNRLKKQESRERAYGISSPER